MVIFCSPVMVILTVHIGIFWAHKLCPIRGGGLQSQIVYPQSGCIRFCMISQSGWSFKIPYLGCVVFLTFNGMRVKLCFCFIVIQCSTTIILCSSVKLGSLSCECISDIKVCRWRLYFISLWHWMSPWIYHVMITWTTIPEEEAGKRFTFNIETASCSWWLKGLPLFFIPPYNIPSQFRCTRTWDENIWMRYNSFLFIKPENIKPCRWNCIVLVVLPWHQREWHLDTHFMGLDMTLVMAPLQRKVTTLLFSRFFF